MWDFKPGDEVVCVADRGWIPLDSDNDEGPKPGEVFVVTDVDFNCGELWLGFAQWPDDEFRATYFRKVQRRDLSTWLSTTQTIEEPKRKPAKAPA